MSNAKSLAGAGARRIAGKVREFPATDKITILMEAVLANRIRGVAALLANGHIIWNQRGPCGRKPEEAALELGFGEIHSMLLAVRERAELGARTRRTTLAADRRL
jgi:hypothetical protein